jgi:phosphoribosylformylglycinamidine synthase
MLWEIEVIPRGRDPERERVCEEFDLLTHSSGGHALVSLASKGYLVEVPGLHSPGA